MQLYVGVTDHDWFQYLAAAAPDELNFRRPGGSQGFRALDPGELFYRYFETTPVTSKYLCVVAKTAVDNPFIITMYFTDAIKQGAILWPTT